MGSDETVMDAALASRGESLIVYKVFVYSYHDQRTPRKKQDKQDRDSDKDEPPYNVIFPSISFIRK
jgi:hypothetical protein